MHDDRQAVCILNSPVGMVSHANADGLNMGGKQDPTVADVETVIRTCFTASEKCDIRAIVALLGHASPSLDAPRDVVWPRLCEAMDDWRSALQCCRKETLDMDRTPWVAHAKLYQAGLLGLCLSMRFTRKRWVRRWFWRLCNECQCDTAVQLADILRAQMDRDDSIIYVAFSFVTSRPYIGAVEARCPILRWNEHWAAIQKSGRGEGSEQKY